MSTPPTTQETYADLVLTLRDLGTILGAAVGAQYEAPPSGVARGSSQIPNPTLDIVLDPRRLALSEAVARTAADLRRATRLVGPHVTHLQNAVARWEGGEEGGTTTWQRTA